MHRILPHTLKASKDPNERERKTTCACENSSHSPSIPISHIQRHCMVILTGRRIVSWNLKVETSTFMDLLSTLAACSDPIPDQRKYEDIQNICFSILNYLQLLTVIINIKNCVLHKWLRQITTDITLICKGLILTLVTNQEARFR